MEELYLLDATVTETNAVKLKFLNAAGKIEVVDSSYRPYFLAEHPLPREDAEVVTRYSGDTQTVEKRELFTEEKKLLTKATWLSAKFATKAAKQFHSKVWESEIDFPKSYVYDKGLVFGALHTEPGWKPVFEVSAEQRAWFERTFQEVKAKDSLKYAETFRWFSLLVQPVPKVPSEFLVAAEVDEERIHSAWMLSRIANIPLVEAARSHHVSDWIKSIIHTYLRRNGVLVPTSEELRKGKQTHRVTGALTIAPAAGVYFNTVVCDFESLYPSCIDSFNLSYETVDCGHSGCRTNKIPDVESHVCTRRRGFYSVLVGALKELRIRLFKPASRDASLSDEERKRAAATAKLLKLITVSSYGVTVRIHGLACPPLAEAMTGYGRYVLRASWNMAEQKGLRPVYGDTDSLFLDNASEEQVKWLIGAVKERFSLDLAVEKRYSLCVLPKAKKAYFGILPDGTPDIKGVTPIKSNSPGYINKVFQQCVRALAVIRNQQEYAEAVKAIKDMVRKAMADLRNKRVPLEDLTYSVRLYFDPNEKVVEMKISPQPYQCALQLIDAGKKLKQGDTVKFVKVKPFEYRGKAFTVKPAEFVTRLDEVNVGDYVRNLLTALNQTFEPMGIKLEPEGEANLVKWLINQDPHHKST